MTLKNALPLAANARSHSFSSYIKFWRAQFAERGVYNVFVAPRETCAALWQSRPSCAFMTHSLLNGDLPRRNNGCVRARVNAHSHLRTHAQVRGPAAMKGVDIIVCKTLSLSPSLPCVNSSPVRTSRVRRTLKRVSLTYSHAHRKPLLIRHGFWTEKKLRNGGKTPTAN